jgi:hypothetical protein
MLTFNSRYCFFHGKPDTIIKHSNAVEEQTSALVKDLVSNAGLIKTDTVIKTFWTHADTKLKNMGNFTGW